MSIYASLPGIDADEPCGLPWQYQGSHVLPAEGDPRGGSIGLAEIPSHITRDRRDDQPEDGTPWPWARLSIDAGDGHAAAVITPTQARHLAAQLTDWADSTGDTDVTDPTTRQAVEDHLRAAIRDALEATDHADHAALTDAVYQAVQGLYVPPPPGSDRDALPDDLRALVAPHMRPYLSTSHETADALYAATLGHPDRAGELREWAGRMAASCRDTRKQDMARCMHPDHRTDGAEAAAPEQQPDVTTCDGCGDDLTHAELTHQCTPCAAVATVAGDVMADAEQTADRLRLAHQARRAKAAQLDDIRHALCDVGVIRDDDPYGHADLADVIRQMGSAAQGQHRPDSHADAELTAEEARALADDLGTQLYRAEDALAFVGECCDIADREQRPITTAQVREWLKGARCGRQLLADRAADTASDEGLREQLAAAMREHWLITSRDAADGDGNAPCRCGDWREPGPMGIDEQDWDSHLAATLLPVIARRTQQLRAERDMLGRETDRLRRDWTTLRTRCEQAEAALARMHALRRAWRTQGAPRLGTSIAREWDKRLAELDAALGQPDTQNS